MTVFTCENCGKEFRSFPSWRALSHAYCGRSCAQEARSRQPTKGINKTTFTCVQCAKPFDRYQTHRRHAVAYCSSACSGLAHSGREMTTYNCETCGVECVRPLSATRARRFCSRACRVAIQESRKVYGGYWFVRVPIAERKARHLRPHRKRAHRAWLAEHIVKAERAMGRPFRQGEVVHHINSDRLDNRNANLLVCNRAYHAALHGEMSRRYARETFGGVS